MWGHGDCQANDGGPVKSRENCPLLSTRVTQRIVFLHMYDELGSQQ